MKKLLNNFELYIGAGLFICIMILLTFQVVSRYVFSYSLTWCEELATIMFMWMIYCGISGAVLTRKHLSIEFFVDILPFKAKKILLIVNNVICMIFCAYITFPMATIITNLYNSTAATSILRMNKALCYTVAPICLVLTVIRYIQESIIMAKENEKELGAAKPVVDVAAIEQEYLNSLAKKSNTVPTVVSKEDITK